MPFTPRDAHELGDSRLASLVRVAQGTAEAHDGIECAVFEPAEIGDVREQALDDTVLEPGVDEPALVEFELFLREVRDESHPVAARTNAA